MNKQALKDRAEELQAELDKIQAEINKPEPVKHKPRLGTPLMVAPAINTAVGVLYTLGERSCFWNNTDTYAMQLAHGLVFATKESAKHAGKVRAAEQRIRTAMYERDGYVALEWGSGTTYKWQPYYNHDSGKWVTMSTIPVLQYAPTSCTSPNKSTIEYLCKHHVDDLNLVWGVEDTQ